MKQGVYANQWGYYPSIICKVNIFLHNNYKLMQTILMLVISSIA